MKTAYKTFPETSTAVDPVTGVSFRSQYNIFTVGAGYVDLQAALANNDLAAGTAMSPVAVLDPNTNRVTLSLTQVLHGTTPISRLRRMAAFGVPMEFGEPMAFGELAFS